MKNSTQFYIFMFVCFVLKCTYTTVGDMYAYHIVEHAQYCDGILDEYYTECPNPQTHLFVSDTEKGFTGLFVFLRVVLADACIVLICLELLIIFFSLLTAFLDSDYSKLERNVTWLFRQFKT